MSQIVLNGDSLIVLKDFPDNSVDSVVTDPPYGLSFMGKKWDYSVPSVEIWREVLRVLKPGGHLLAFGGTRTYHRMVINIEDAGFEVRDQIMWLYGSGFPKSMDVSKAIDRMAGAQRESIGKGKPMSSLVTMHDDNWESDKEYQITAPATPLAKQWQGWGTALKPANEPIVLARKPLEKGLTVAANVLKWGCGAINVDASRVCVSEDAPSVTNFGSGGRPIDNLNPQGRWPANLILDETAAEMLDAQSGTLKSGAGNTRKKPHNTNAMSGRLALMDIEEISYGDSGGASRFFYVAKASKSERNAGLEGETKEKQGVRPNSADSTGGFPDHDHRPTGGNNHPTVKPVKLMEYLIKLITPPGGVVLDPFTGSGSTGVAAKRLGFSFLGVEMSEEYCKIAEKRIEAA